MTTSRFRRTNRRRFVASSVIGGAAVLTNGQPLRAGSKTSPPATLLAQDDSSDVPMFRGNAARTGEMPGPGPEASNGVDVIWRFTAGRNNGAYHISPAILDGVVYVGSLEGDLYALSAKDGTERWQFAIGGVASSAEVVSDVLYVGSWNFDENLTTYYAVNAKDGTERWRFPTGAANKGRPVVADDVVYFVGDPHLFAVDAGTGTVRWRFTEELAFPSDVMDGVVYVEVAGTDLVALSSEDGTERWRFSTGGWSRPTVINGVVYVESAEGYVYALNAEDGTERWRFTTDPSSIKVMDGVIYVGSRDGNLYALNAEDGTEKWRFTTSDEDPHVGNIVDGAVYVSCDGYFCAVSAADGTERWRFAQGGVSVPFAVDGVVYFGGGVVGPDADLYALNADDGAELWQIAISDAVQVHVRDVVDGMVYATNGVGNLYAIGARVPRLSVGGTARVAEKTMLRGGPALTAVERAELAPDTAVTITGEAETTGDVIWWPLTVDETGDQGWVEASKLEPLTSGPEPTATS